jgi:hypothetical protein
MAYEANQFVPEGESEFARMLKADADLALKCEQVAKTLRDAADNDIKAAERSERLTKQDFAIW